MSEGRCPVSLERRLLVVLSALLVGGAVTARLLVPMEALGPDAPRLGLALRFLPAVAGLVVGLVALWFLPARPGCRAPRERRGLAFLATWAPFAAGGAAVILDARTLFVRAVGGSRNVSGTFETIAIGLALAPIFLVMARRLGDGSCSLRHYRAPMSLEVVGVALLVAFAAAGVLLLGLARTVDERLGARLAFFVGYGVLAFVAERRA